MLPYTYAPPYDPYGLMYLAEQSPSFESLLEQRDMELTELPGHKGGKGGKKGGKGGTAAATASGPTRWYKISPSMFNSGFSRGGSGGCVGGIKNAKYMKPPFITKSGNSITASTQNEKKACLYQSTGSSCRVPAGSAGA